MEAFDYSKLQTSAAALLARFGKSYPILRRNPSYDPLLGQHTGDAPQVGNLTAVVLPASKGTVEAFDIRLGKEGLTLDQLRFCLTAALGAPFRPQPTDIVTYEGRQWTVLGCTPLDPAGTPLIYKIAIRKM